MANIGDLVVNLDANTQGLERGIDRATQATGRYRDAAGRMREANGKFVSSAERAGGAIQQTGRNAAAAGASFATLGQRIAQVSGLLASIGVGFGIGAIVNQFADFEQGMRNVAAVSGSTAQELEKLESSALRAAASTRFNPQQTTQALYALASSGQSAEEQMASLSNVLNLAEAGQADLGTSTELLTSSLNQFSLQADDSQRVADVFVASIGASALNVNRLQVALRNAGPTAAALGQSIEQTTAVLGSLTTAFGNGERAGTGFRAIMAELPDNAEDLGISIRDANGNFLSMVEILRQLEQRGVTANQVVEMFGAEAGPALAALLSQGSDALETMEGRLESTGQAADTAAEQLDTLRGDLDAFSSAVSVAFVEMGDSQSGLFRSTVQTTTNLIRLWSGYGDELGEARQSTELLAGAIELLAIAAGARLVSALATATATMVTTAAAAGTLRTALLGINPVLTGLVGGAGLLFMFREELSLIQDPAADARREIELLTGAIEDMNDSSVQSAMISINAQMFDLERQAREARRELEEISQDRSGGALGMAPGTTGAQASLQGQLGQIGVDRAALEERQQQLLALTTGVGELSSVISDEAIQSAVQLADSTRKASDALDEFSARLTPEVEDILERAGPGATIDAEGQIRDAWGNTLPTLQRQLEDELQGQVNAFSAEQNLMKGLEEAAKRLTDEAETAAKQAFGSIKPASQNAVREAMNEAKNIGSLTFKLESADGTSETDVEGDADDLRRLANLFSGVASAV